MNAESDERARVPTPHDALFKHTFSQPRDAASFLESVLPEALQRKLDLSSMELLSGSFVDANLSERHTDLLFSARLEGRKTLVYVLLEHQSTVVRLMAFRVLGYIVRIWEKYVRDNPGAITLPPILPVVVFNGETPWSAPAELSQLIGLSAMERAAFEAYLPRLNLLVENLTARTAEELQRRKGTVAKRITEALLARGRKAKRLEDILPNFPELLLKLGGTPGGLFTFHAFVTYTSEVAELDQAEVRGIARQLGPEAEEALMTTAEKLRQEGRAEGRTEGRAEGRAEGLLRLLRLRFGPLSEEVVARVWQADLQALDRWTDAILSAPTLEEALR